MSSISQRITHRSCSPHPSSLGAVDDQTAKSMQKRARMGAGLRLPAIGVLPVAIASPLARLEPYGMLILIGLLFVLPMLGANPGDRPQHRLAGDRKFDKCNHRRDTSNDWQHIG